MSQPFDASSSSTRADPLGSELARAVFEASTECLIVLDPQGTVLAVNRAFCDLYGIDAADTVGGNSMGFSRDFEIRRFGDPLDHDNWVTARALRGETVRGVVQGLRNRVTGREFFGRYGATPVFGDGRLVATVITVLDVTDATRAAQALDAALSAAEVGTWRAAMKERRIWVDANFARICGLPEDAVQDLALDRLYDIIHPEDRARATLEFRQATERGQPHEVEYRIVHPDGAVRWLVSRGTVALALSGEPTERVGSIIDVTRQKEVELALEARGAFIRSTIDAVPAFIAFLDVDLVYRLCNRRFEEWFGRPRAEIVGRPIREILGEATFERVRPYLEMAVAGEASGYAQWLDFPQGRRFMRASYTPSFDAQGRVEGLSAMIDDETEQRLTEERLRASEERLRKLVEAATVGVVVNDAKGRFLYANPPLLAMLGYAREDVLAGRLSWDLVQVPELRPRDDRALDQLRETGACDPYETELIARDGRRVPVYVGAAFVPDESGEGVLGAAFITDLTPLKSAQEELETLNHELDAKVRERTAELERANRDLSEFSYSVAHDLRAPLRAIVSTSRILLEDAAGRLTEDERALLQRQSTNGVRLARIVDDLLNFGRLAKADLRKRPFDLTALARVAGEEVCGRWPDGCEIEVQEGMGAVGDPSLVGYALTNLLDNACKFSPQGGAVTVGREGGAFFVRDQGVGFDMEHAHKLFVAFERLVDQEAFPGTGVGLANVKRIVERHGGRVWAESKPGKGATFWFTLDGVGV